MSCWHPDSAHHPQPGHTDFTELPQLEAGPGCEAEMLGFPKPHPPILPVVATGHTASGAHDSRRVHPACLQDAVGRSAGLSLCPPGGRKVISMEMRGREKCPESPALSPPTIPRTEVLFMPNYWQTFCCSPHTLLRASQWIWGMMRRPDLAGGRPWPMELISCSLGKIDPAMTLLQGT